jgi:hypothetical protein
MKTPNSTPNPATERFVFISPLATLVRPTAFGVDACSAYGRNDRTGKSGSDADYAGR